ncbi:hypothetical protein ACWGCK_38285, partial [Streptomyces virginiae]
MTDTTPWRPASGPPAGAGHARVPGAPGPGVAGHPQNAPGPAGPVLPGGSGASRGRLRQARRASGTAVAPAASGSAGGPE